MASRWKAFAIEPVGGLNLDENPLSVRANELIDALNVWYRGKTLGTRPGASFETEGGGYAAVLPGAVQGGYEWLRDNGATRNLMVVANGTIYSDGTPTAVTEGAGVIVAAGADRRWTFAQFGYGAGATQNARVFAAGGATTDTPWYWAGSGNATLLSITDSGGVNLVSPEYIFGKWNRLFACKWRTAAGALSTDIACNPMTPRYSALGDPLTWPTGNTFAGTGIGGLPAFGDEYATGFSEYTDNDGDWLLFLTNRKIYAVQEDAANPNSPFSISRRGAIEFGCVSQRAFVPLGLDSGDAIFLSDVGIHSLRQTQLNGRAAAHVLSWKIRSFFRTLNRSRLAYATGSYLREEGLVVFAVPVGSDTANTVLLVLDLKSATGEDQELNETNARWSIWRVTGPSSSYSKITTLFPARSSDGTPYLYGGSEAGAVLRFDEDAAHDFGTSYESRFATRWEDFGDATVEKTLGDVYVDTQPPRVGAVTLRVATDFGARVSGAYAVDLPVSTAGVWNVGVWNAATWGSGAATNHQRVYAQAHGNHMSFRFNSTAASSFYIAGISGRVTGTTVAREVA